MIQRIIRLGIIVLLLFSTIINMFIPTVMAEDRNKVVLDNHAQAVLSKTCGNPIRTVNGSFEIPRVDNNDGMGFFHPNQVPGWDTIPFRPLTDEEYAIEKGGVDKSGRAIEIQSEKLGITKAKEGTQYAELNAVVGGVLFTTVPVPVPKRDVYISVFHKQRESSPAEKMYIVSGLGTPEIQVSGSGENMRGEVVNTIYKSPEYTATATWEERKVKIPASSLPDSGDIYLGFYTPDVNRSVGNLIDNVHFGTPACLEYEKKAPEKVHVGETFNYTITAKNVGGYPAKEINLKDVLPEQVVTNGKPTAKVINATTKQTKSVDLQFISQNDYSQMKYNDKIGIDDSIEFTIPVKAVSAGEAKSQSSLMYKDTATNADVAWEQTNTVSTLIEWEQADVSIQKSIKSSDGIDEIFPGHLMEYVIEVKNHTLNSEITNAIVEDLLPEGVELAGDINIMKQPEKLEMTTQHTGKQLLYKIPKLQGNESISIRIPVKVLPAAMQTTVSNTAKLTYQQPNQQLVTKESTADFKVLPLNPLIKLKKKVEKVGGGDTYNVGDRVKYIITAENTIPSSIADAINLKVFDKLPEGITVDESSIQMSVPEGTYTFDPNVGQLSFHLGQLTSGNVATMTFEGVLNEKSLEKVVVNTVSAKVDLPNGGGEFEPNPSNPATIMIQSKEPKLVGEKSHKDVNGGKVKVGDTIQYTVRAKQEEVGASLKNTVIEDTLPEYLQYKEGSGKIIKMIDGKQQETQLPVHAQNNKLVAQLGDIRNVEEYIFTFEVEVLRSGAGKAFSNEAHVKGNKPIIDKDGTVKLGKEVNLTVQDQGELAIKPYDEPTKPMDPENPKEPIDPVDPTTPDKKPSEGTKGPLSIDFVSSLRFGEQVISFKDKTYFAKAQEFADGSQKMNYIQITDNRMNGASWTLSVKQNGPLKDEEGHELDGAKITFHNAEVLSSNQMPELSLVKDSFEVTNDIQDVLVGKSGTEESTYVYRFGDEETKESSIQLEVPGETPKYATTYKTSLTWLLSDVPVN